MTESDRIAEILTAWYANSAEGSDRDPQELLKLHPELADDLKERIEALESLTRRCRVSLVTDSQYVKLGITTWLSSWKRNNWKRKGGAVKNVDLWKRLDQATGRHDIRWEWVRGHTGVPENERCDELVGEAIERIRSSQT